MYFLSCTAVSSVSRPYHADIHSAIEYITVVSNVSGVREAYVADTHSALDMSFSSLILIADMDVDTGFRRIKLHVSYGIERRRQRIRRRIKAEDNVSQYHKNTSSVTRLHVRYTLSR